jgi:hypothetical protein
MLQLAFAALCPVRNWVSRNFVDLALMVVKRGWYTLISWTNSDYIFGTVNPIVDIKPLQTVFSFPSQFLGVLCRPEIAHRHRILLYSFSLGPAIFDNLLYIYVCVCVCVCVFPYIIACRIPPRCHALHLMYKSFCSMLWHDSTSTTKTVALSGEMLG